MANFRPGSMNSPSTSNALMCVCTLTCVHTVTRTTWLTYLFIYLHFTVYLHQEDLDTLLAQQPNYPQINPSNGHMHI